MTQPDLQTCLNGAYTIEEEVTDLDDGQVLINVWYEKMPGCMAKATAGEVEDARLAARRKLETFKEPYLRKLVENGGELPVPDAVVEQTPPSETSLSGEQAAVSEVSYRVPGGDDEDGVVASDEADEGRLFQVA